MDRLSCPVLYTLSVRKGTARKNEASQAVRGVPRVVARGRLRGASGGRMRFLRVCNGVTIATAKLFQRLVSTGSYNI